MWSSTESLDAAVKIYFLHGYLLPLFLPSLRQVDVEFMRRLQNKVNIVPVIAKADALTASELRDLKERIMSDLDRYKIDIYRLPECDSDEEEEIKRLDKEIKASFIFCLNMIYFC